MSKKIENPIVLIHKRENSDSYAVAITSGSQNYHDALLMASMEPGMHGNDIDTWSKTGYYMAAEIEKLRDCLKQAEENYLRAISETDCLEVKKQRLTLAAKRIIRWNRQEAADRTGNTEDAESYACVRELRDALAFCESSRSSSAGTAENSRGNEKVQVVQEQSGTTHGLVVVRSDINYVFIPNQGVDHVDRVDREARPDGEATLVNGGITGKPLTITLPDISSKAFWSGSGKNEVFHPETYKRWTKEAIERYCAIAQIEVEVR
ncbi:hypothetical protein SB6413_02262 [Klebsiella pasteurii]|nr:hypothetical protein SB6413_02262 [Klebsiella pasteurii]